MGDIYTRIEAVVRYRTEDGEWWATEAEANAWHRNLRERAEMNAMLSAGATLGEIAARFPHWRQDGVSGGVADLADALRSVTAAHRFVISHWQCNDGPVYAISHFNKDGTVYVGGHGGWAGHYGNDMTLLNLARYPVCAPGVCK